MEGLRSRQPNPRPPATTALTLNSADFPPLTPSQQPLEASPHTPQPNQRPASPSLPQPPDPPHPPSTSEPSDLRAEVSDMLYCQERRLRDYQEQLNHQLESRLANHLHSSFRQLLDTRPAAPQHPPYISPSHAFSPPLTTHLPVSSAHPAAHVPSIAPGTRFPSTPHHATPVMTLPHTSPTFFSPAHFPQPSLPTAAPWAPMPH